MKNINRRSIVKPIELDSSDCQNHLNSIIANPALKALGDFYRGKKVNPDGTKEYTVVNSLKIIYKNKCAYCEKRTYLPKIDHHRPKGRVEGAGPQNRGYYWLSYEWSNLLPACSDCNGLEAKKNKYPLINPLIRNHLHPTNGTPPITHPPLFIYDSTYNQSECPLLLHPEYCVPESNFIFDKHGKIIGTTTEGVKTVEVLKLDHPDLNGWRRKIYDDHLTNLKNIVRRYFRPNKPITELLFEELIFEWTEQLVNDANNDELEYTLFRKFLLTNIESFFILELDPVFQNETKNKISESLLLIAA